MDPSNGILHLVCFLRAYILAEVIFNHNFEIVEENIFENPSMKIVNKRLEKQNKPTSFLAK